MHYIFLYIIDIYIYQLVFSLLAYIYMYQLIFSLLALGCASAHPVVPSMYVLYMRECRCRTDSKGLVSRQLSLQRPVPPNCKFLVLSIASKTRIILNFNLVLIYIYIQFTSKTCMALKQFYKQHDLFQNSYYILYTCCIIL